MMDMAALRAFSRLRRGFFSGAAETLCWTGFDFCASRSGTLILAASVPSFCGFDACSLVNSSGLLLLFFGGGPAIDVSGTPVFRGGGGGGKSVRLCDRYSGAV